MDTRLQEGIIGFLLFVVGKENQTDNFICKWGNSLMCKTVVRSALPFFLLLFYFILFLAWHTCHCNFHTNDGKGWSPCTHQRDDFGELFAELRPHSGLLTWLTQGMAESEKEKTVACLCSIQLLSHSINQPAVENHLSDFERMKRGRPTFYGVILFLSPEGNGLLFVLTARSIDLAWADAGRSLL